LEGMFGNILRRGVHCWMSTNTFLEKEMEHHIINLPHNETIWAGKKSGWHESTSTAKPTQNVFVCVWK
jgi:hypothetical protein